jgi:8-oxo-dGTP pyrophosphatase MutT (NUDIX family)
VRREFSAGTVLVRRMRDNWWVAVIRPAGRPPGTWVLPKGRVEPGESSQQAALRELGEETGLAGRPIDTLGAVEYWFSDNGERVLKTVAFFLVAYASGALSRLPDAARNEVAEARWLQLAQAPSALAYRGEREVAKRAIDRLSAGQSV